MTTLITGAAGFVGHNLGLYLATRHSLRLAVRALSAGESLRSFGEVVAVGNVCSTTDWTESLKGVHAVVHLANRAHVLRETATDPAAACREVNVDGTRRLAEQAVAAGVRRLVYLSSVKVLGERTQAQAFGEASLPAPEDPYGESKRDAEQVLRDIAARTGLEVVVLRPPLVYGPGVGANFLRLMQWVARGIPLPVAAIHNRRSLIYVGNLASAIEACLLHPAAAGRTYLVSDGAPVSTAQLVTMLAAALAVSDRSWALSPALLRLTGMALGMSGEVARLVDSLVVDDDLIRRELGWNPPFSTAEGLRDTAIAYRAAGG
ncbi:MAG: NAD-dependent epimerase/dehydratase family protein [Burkholderiales bacterium]|nr:NAD-dependent epimerase/dehydratase family protein [Burkholderiales bacterium]